MLMSLVSKPIIYSLRKQQQHSKLDIIAQTSFGESTDLNSKVHCPLGSMSLVQLTLPRSAPLSQFILCGGACSLDNSVFFSIFVPCSRQVF